MDNPMISADNVSMSFRLYKERSDSLKEYFINFTKGRLQFEEFYALKNISFSMQKGESVALLGANGSGKSTLLKCVAGVLSPSSGKITINGHVSPMIELGAGFDTELTAHENIYLNGAVLGYSRAQIDEVYNDIVAFSELQEFMEVPIKNFSSGMYARLGFSIAIVRQPDILIVDEVLAVGDIHFQAKCEERIKQMLDNNATFLFVSQLPGQVRQLCKRTIWLDRGKIHMDGPSDTVCDAYERHMLRK